MSNNKLLELYLDNCNAMYKKTGDGLHVISTPEDDYFYSTFDEMISDIKYTVSQWELENIAINTL